MPTLTIPPGDSFTVRNVQAIEYAGSVYKVDGDITLGDGTTTTCNALLVANGGAAYAETELKRCFKVEGYDPDAKNASWFSLYSSNSKQTGKNEAAKVPGGMWCEQFDFEGGARADGKFDNGILEMWRVTGQSYDTAWIGFRLAYGTTDNRAYVLTYQDDFLEESVPTPAVNIDGTFMHDALIHGVFKRTPNDLTGHYYVPIHKIHLWRTTVGTDGTTVYRRVPAEAVSNGLNSEGVILEFSHVYGRFTLEIPDYTKSYGYQFRDSFTDEELLTEELVSTDWDPPPFRQALQLVGLWNGMMAIHVDNTVMFCEPYRPHAWPSKYRYPLPFEIVSKAVDGNSLLVTTTGPAYLFTGTHPSTMTWEPIANTQAGKRAQYMVGGSSQRAPGRAICRTPIGVCYATDDGIVATDAGRSRLITGKLFTKEEWKARYGAMFGRLRMAYSNGHIMVWMDRTAETGFIIDLAGTSLTQWTPSPGMGPAVQMPGSDGLYVTAGLGAGSNSTLQRFEDPSANRMVASWLSRKVILPRPLNFGCFQIVGSGLVLVSITAGARLVLTQLAVTLIDGVPQTLRLPFGFREREWTARFDLNTNAVVREFYLAGTPDELRGV